MPGTTKAGKKRPAPSQAGPKPKKIQLVKPLKPEGKRSQPITAPAVPSDAEDSDSLGDLDNSDLERDEWIDEEKGFGDDEEYAMDEDSPLDPGLAKSKDPNGMSSPTYIHRRKSTSMQLLVNHTKLKKLCNPNAEPPNPILPSSQMLNVRGHSRGKKTSSRKSGRSISRT
jgi:hypothetical protein